jgi:N-acetylmuramic acid 6-phosphate etherase
MSESSQKRAEEFLKISSQFKLGGLITESPHPVTANLSEIAKADIGAALSRLFDVDSDVINKYREFVESDRAGEIQQTVLKALRDGGKLFFTGCGSTGRLSIQLVSIWRDFWQQQRTRGLKCSPSAQEFENRAFSVMAGGDYALIKAVEGFEDFTEFGKKQLADLGVSAKDVVFAITEGGETSFVIGTAWKGVEAGAKVYFVYNNPDEILCQQVQRSSEVIEDERIEKINLTTGPMAITGSTRMQATTIQLCVLLTILEMTLRKLLGELEPGGPCALDPATVPNDFLHKLMALHARFKSPKFLPRLASLVALEESVYRSAHKNNYFADRFGIDVLTDTTERSPTYCTPPFRKFDDTAATESWAFLFVAEGDTPLAWERIIKRKQRCVEWTEKEIRTLVPPDKLARTLEIVAKISARELMRFRIGLDGLAYRTLGAGDSAIGILAEDEKESLLSPRGFHRSQLEAARKTGASVGVVFFGRDDALKEVEAFVSAWNPESVLVLAPVPRTDFLLDGVTRVGVKILLNALSTCTMVRLGRVMGNYMIWVVPSNLKLIDRATRYIQKLAGLDYASANELLFEVIEYVEPRMKADQAYPPVVGLSVMRSRDKLSNQEAEKKFLAEL